MEKATYTGHVAHKKNKLISREIYLEKATYTGHVAHKKKQVNFKGNSSGKGYVHWTRSSQLTLGSRTLRTSAADD